MLIPGSLRRPTQVPLALARPGLILPRVLSNCFPSLGHFFVCNLGHEPSQAPSLRLGPPTRMHSGAAVPVM